MIEAREGWWWGETQSRELEGVIKTESGEV